MKRLLRCLILGKVVDSQAIAALRGTEVRAQQGLLCLLSRTNGLSLFSRTAGGDELKSLMARLAGNMTYVRTT